MDNIKVVIIKNRLEMHEEKTRIIRENLITFLNNLEREALGTFKIEESQYSFFVRLVIQKKLWIFPYKDKNFFFSLGKVWKGEQYISLTIYKPAIPFKGEIIKQLKEVAVRIKINKIKIKIENK